MRHLILSGYSAEKRRNSLNYSFGSQHWKSARTAAILLMTCLLSACHYFDGQTISIPRTQKDNIAQLRTPPGTAIAFDTLYPIPSRHYPAVKEVNIAPPGLNSSLNSDNSTSSGEVPKRS